MANVRLEHIYKVYPNGTKAVSDFTMDIKDKEFIVFVGPSGCGKSTTLRMIAGLEDISAGELYIDDKIVNNEEPKDRDIAMVFQNYALYPHMTVYENIAFGLKLRHVPAAEIHEKVLWAAEVLDLVEYLDRKPKAMSGGQRQRVALGRAIIRNPKVMLLDEPLSNLDAKLRTQMRSEISKLHDKLQTTFIYVTHDQVEAMTLGTRVVVMKKGEIMQVDTPKNLYDYPNNLFVATFIGTPQMNVFKAKLFRNGEDINIKFKWSEESLNVKHRYLAKVKPQYFDSNVDVLFGVRCEDLSVDPEVVKNSQHVFNAKVSHFEELGNETLIYADINMFGDGFDQTHTRVIIKGKHNYGLKKGDICKVAIDVEKVHLFDEKTEVSINKRIPDLNLVSCEVNDKTLSLADLKFNLPEAIKVNSDKYDLLVPINAVKLNNKEGRLVEILKSEEVESKRLCHIKCGENLLFALVDNNLDLNQNVYLDIDFTQVKFLKDGNVVFDSVSEYDRINAMFLNYLTAKSLIGDKYDKVIEDRVNEVNNYYDSKISLLDKEYQDNLTKYANINKQEILAKYQSELTNLKETTKNKVNELKQELKESLNKERLVHLENNKKIISEVKETYERIKNEEIEAFNTFKMFNKDRDAYRKRLSELNDFKANHQLEEKNELEKRLNLESVRFESENNHLRGNFKRNKTEVEETYNNFKARVLYEANPLVKITKDYKSNVKALRLEKEEKLSRAKIIFFFKTNNLVTLATDDISNKMIQGLGIKVFTKEYLLEIPHDAYKVDSNGLNVKCVDILNYGTKVYYKCLYKDQVEEKFIYLLLNEKYNINDEITVSFDITKCHITEKAMDIKIY